MVFAVCVGLVFAADDVGLVLAACVGLVPTAVEGLKFARGAGVAGPVDDRRQAALDLPHVGAALRRIDGHHAQDQVLGGRRNVDVGGELADPGTGRLNVEVEDAHRLWGVEGDPPGEHLEEHAAEGVDVGACVHGLAAGLLGRHVGGGAEHDAGLGQGRLALHLGDSEVEDFHELELVAALDHIDVGRFHVPVDHAHVVGGLESAGDLQGEVPGPGPRQAVLGAQDLLEVLALEQLHDEEGRALGDLVDVADVDHVGVTDAGGGPSLPHEALDEFPIVGHLRAEDLDGHRLAEAEVLALVDAAHATLAYESADEVAAE